MMNYCAGSHHKYLNYKCYEYLSRKLDVPEYSENKNRYLESALASLEKGKYDKFSQDNIIKNLAARLGSDGVFLNADVNAACNYINYKLNESLKTYYGHMHDIDYNIFKDFAKAFYNKKHNNNYTNTSCENYIEPLDKDMYNRLKILYKMLYHYNELKSPYKYTHDYSNVNFCNNLNLLVFYSKEAIDQNTQNHEYISSIKKLKEIIDKDNEKEKYKDKCDLNVLNGMIYKLTNSELQISREEGSAINSHAAAKTEQHHELKHQKRDEENEQELKQQTSKEDTGRELESTDKIAIELVPREQAEWELTTQEPAAKAQESEIHVKAVQSGIYPSMIRQVSNDQEVTGLLEERYISKEIEAPKVGTEGVLVKMQGFITDTLGQVEPAPILGVSGGMGVLFILFKYTPFGSFFGGRRRRMHQIPSSFRGFPPDFANFQEYGGGYVGYSPMDIYPLAE